MESNHSVANTFYEILVCELSRLVFSPSRRVTGKVKSVSQRTCLAKRSAQVSHVINAGFRVLAALLGGPHYLVVDFLEVPIIHYDHQHFEPVKFASSNKRIALPRPQSDVLETIVAPLKPDIRCVTPGHPVDVNPADEVVLIRVISHRPYKSRCRCLGSSFGPELNRPIPALLILNIDLLLGAFGVITNVCEFSVGVGSAFATTRSIKHVEALDASRLVPENRMALAAVHDTRLFLLAFLFFFAFVLLRLLLSRRGCERRRIEGGHDKHQEQE